MWCDSFDADLLAVIPGAADALGSAADVRLWTYSHLTNGKINCPSAWNTADGLVSFFWTSDEHKLDASFYTDAAVAGCTFLEAVRDEWVHGCMVSVNGQVVWQPPVRPMERLMYDVRGWTVLADAKREDIRHAVRQSLERAAQRLAAVIGDPAPAVPGASAPSLHELWREAGGGTVAYDRQKYHDLLLEHHVLVRWPHRGEEKKS
jgi:hypothetical protein